MFFAEIGVDAAKNESLKRFSKRVNAYVVDCERFRYSMLRRSLTAVVFG